MATTHAPAPTRPPATGSTRRLSIRWISLIAAVTIVVIVGVLITGSDAEPTHRYELNGSLADDLGGPSLVTAGGELTDAGFEFGFGDGLTLDVDLGESYTIEMRIRIDGASGQWVKLLDFRNAEVESGLYIVGGTSLDYYFSEGCGGVTDIGSACGDLVINRVALHGTPDAVLRGEFNTITMVRDGDADTFQVFVNDELQRWTWERSREVAADDRTATIVDPVGEATLSSGSVLSILIDDSQTGGNEVGRGELDYLYLTVE